MSRKRKAVKSSGAAPRRAATRREAWKARESGILGALDRFTAQGRMTAEAILQLADRLHRMTLPAGLVQLATSVHKFAETCTYNWRAQERSIADVTKMVADTLVPWTSAMSDHMKTIMSHVTDTTQLSNEIERVAANDRAELRALAAANADMREKMANATGNLAALKDENEELRAKVIRYRERLADVPGE